MAAGADDPDLGRGLAHLDIRALAQIADEEIRIG
jgi:hypothetical protein